MFNYYQEINKNVLFSLMYKKSVEVDNAIHLTLADKKIFDELVLLAISNNELIIEKTVEDIVSNSIYSKSTIIKSLSKLEKIGIIHRIKTKRIFKPIGNFKYQKNKPYLTKIDEKFLGEILVMDLKEKLNNEERYIINSYFNNGINEKVNLDKFIKHLDFIIISSTDEHIKLIYNDLKEKLLLTDEYTWNKLLLEIPIETKFDETDVDFSEENED